MADHEAAAEVALAILGSDQPLQPEPAAHDFVDWKAPPYGGAFERVIDCDVYLRASRQRDRIQAMFNREMCALVPVECRRCGENFHRERINQVHCGHCRAVRRGDSVTGRRHEKGGR